MSGDGTLLGAIEHRDVWRFLTLDRPRSGPRAIKRFVFRVNEPGPVEVSCRVCHRKLTINPTKEAKRAGLVPGQGGTIYL